MKSEININPIDYKRLQTIPLFQKLEDEQLAQIVQTGKVQTMNKGGFFFFQTDLAEVVYVLLAGRIKLTQLSAEGQQVLLRAISPYSMFGAVAMTHRERYPVSAEAAETSQVLAIRKEEFMPLVQRIPQLAINALSLMADNVQEFQERLREVTTERAERRLAHTLLRLAAQTGMKTSEGVVINLPLTRQELASMSGASLTSISRILSQWEKMNLVQSGQEQFVITYPHGLVNIAEDLPLEAR